MSFQRVFFISKQPPPESPPADFEEIMRSTARNTGNIFFMEALWKQVRSETRGYGYDFDPNELVKNYDSLAICAANWVSGGNKLITARLAKLIQQTDLPCLVAGLGAQSLDEKSFPRISKDTHLFLKLLSERSKVIGVRGEYTRRVLQHYGIKNVMVVGCPSYFWGLLPTLHVQERRARKPIVAVNASRRRTISGDIDAKKLEVERSLYRFAFENEGSFFVAQSEEFEIHIALGVPVDQIAEKYVQPFREFCRSEMPNVPLEALRDKFRVFRDVRHWMAELSKADFVIGTRLHGCLMGLMAGVPSLLISIDSRTKELAEYLRIPTLSIRDVKLPLDVNQLYQELDLAPAIEAYPQLFAVYRQFLEANGVGHNLVA